MAVDANDILRIVTKWSGPYWSQIQNTFFAHLAGTGTAADSDVYTGVKVWLQDMFGEIETALSDDLSFLEGVVDVVEWVLDGWKTVKHVTMINNLTGVLPASTSDPLPPACCALLSFPTLLPGHVGRKYIGGLTEGAVGADGELTSTVLTQMGAFATQYLDGYAIPNSSLTLDPVIVSSEGDAYYALQSSTVAPQVSYQRRRKTNVGI